MLVTMLTLLLAVPAFAGDKKKQADRAMIEKMEAVPCGAKEQGIDRLGRRLGIRRCYAREFRRKTVPAISVADRRHGVPRSTRSSHKHPVLLPVGQEGEFKVKKDEIDMRVPEGNGDIARSAIIRWSR